MSKSVAVKVSSPQVSASFGIMEQEGVSVLKGICSGTDLGRRSPITLGKAPGENKQWRTSLKLECIGNHLISHHFPHIAGFIL